MEQLYGLNAFTPTNLTSDQYYSSSSMAPVAVPEENLDQQLDYYNYYRNFQPSAAALRPDSMFSGSSSGVSDAASMVAAAGTQIGSGEELSCAMHARIASHPLYPKLLQAYIDCQKVGAPPEIAHVLEEIRRKSDRRIAAASDFSTYCMDPDLDVFMETYCDMLEKYKSDLTKPFDEAITFLSKMETQLNTLSCNNTTANDHAIGSSEEEDLNGGEMDALNSLAATSEDHELKDRLMRKYSGYISTLKHEFCNKKKKGKLPKEARQILFDWWNLHYKWPYPTEFDKITLAQVTGLDQKQINNWFINQRKRHWKPSENMQFTVMDSLYGSRLTNAD